MSDLTPEMLRALPYHWATTPNSEALDALEKMTEPYVVAWEADRRRLAEAHRLLSEYLEGSEIISEAAVWLSQEEQRDE